MLTVLAVLGGLAEFERELITARTTEDRARRCPWGEDGTQAEADRTPAEGGATPSRSGRDDSRGCGQLQRSQQHDIEVSKVISQHETTIWSLSIISKNNMAPTCWSGLRRFHNLSSTTDMIERLHKPPSKQRANMKKQAEQIRYCLMQAKEYYDAAFSVSLATRPVLLYYSVMSLALAEILLKQDGGSSLDKARGENAHHGLEFRIDSLKSGFATDLNYAASSLKAVPLIREGGRRFGTFDLWHRSSRELPLAGELRTTQSGTGQVLAHRIILGAEPKPLPPIPASGITLLECLTQLPSMVRFMGTYGINARVVRSRISANNSSNSPGMQVSVVIHPHNSEVLDDLYNAILVRPSDIDRVHLTELESGIIIRISTDGNDPGPHIIFPQAAMMSKDDAFFFPKSQALNEFGLFYVALHIVGNYARYYPDKWIYDIDNATPLALAVEELLGQAEQRLPLLALTEMSRNYVVPDTL